MISSMVESSSVSEENPTIFGEGACCFVVVVVVVIRTRVCDCVCEECENGEEMHKVLIV